MKKRMFVCLFIFTVSVFHLSSWNIVFGQELAKDVFERHKETFQHPDVNAFFPDVLRAFCEEEIQSILDPSAIGIILNNPGFLKTLHPEVAYQIVGLLTIDDDFRDLFMDRDFQTVLQDPTEIKELARLIEEAGPEGGNGSEPGAPPAATTLTIVSGFGQAGWPRTRLRSPFVVEVRDQYGELFSGATVNFSVVAGSGRLSQTTATTINGRTSVTLTLGSEAGENRVVASVNGIELSQTFTATAIAVNEPQKATTLVIVSGDGQIGQFGTDLRDKFVVEVRDQYGELSSSVTVNFTVKAGGGRLPPAIVRTTNGQASVTLTLGSGKGENRVEASVEGVRQTQTFTATAIDADVNDDGVVSIIDLSIVLALIVQPDRDIAGVDADINDDEIVDYKDLVLVDSVLEWTAAAPSIHALVKSGISAADLRVLLTQAEALPEAIQADPVYQRGIIGLERLLAILTQVPAVPKQTALLVNYPNPFNPETWIPYRLSEASDVTVDIYALNGSRVRTLALGHRPAGLYQRKSRAAYWDGRNEFGEPVASGLYFYTLTAGDFTATRKMLIRK